MQHFGKNHGSIECGDRYQNESDSYERKIFGMFMCVISELIWSFKIIINTHRLIKIFNIFIDFSLLFSG